MSSVDSGKSHAAGPDAALEAGDLSGLHDFDLRVGQWRAHHRRLRQRLTGCHEWDEFYGTTVFRPLMGGWANIDDNVFELAGKTWKGVTLRSYDAKSGMWAIWWLDGRNPFGNLDPPIRGRFAHGVGTFYADDLLSGKPIRMRLTFSEFTADSAHWEQAFSDDGGTTWEKNWFTEFRRTG